MLSLTALLHTDAMMLWVTLFLLFQQNWLEVLNF